MTRLLSTLLLLLLPSWVLAGAPERYSLKTPGIVQDIVTVGGKVVVTLANGTSFLLINKNGKYITEPSSAPQPSAVQRPDNILPDGNIVSGTGLIRRAWLSAPTARYDHGVLGDEIEAGAISAVLADGRRLDFSLSEDAVFEDRTPRLVDLNGDQQEELLVVKTYLDRGAALAIVTADKQNLQIAAEARAIGLSNRWLNPVGVADFDGDGINEVAAVITPHIGGTLTLYEWRANKLIEDHAEYGFSNHQMGSRNQDLSVLLDINKDGIVDMVLPDAGRSSLLAVTFASGTYQTLFSIPLEGAITAPIRSADINGDGRAEIIYATTTGNLTVLSLKP
jgi:hypothetical protein